MKCPACEHNLKAVSLDTVTVDVCKDGGCGGIWFDQHELSKADEPDEPAGDKLVELQNQEAKTQVSDDSRRICPKCPNVKLMRHYFSAKRQVLVDECPKCGGIWLDAGELHHIRSEYNTETDRTEAARRYFEEMFIPQSADFADGDRRADSFKNMRRMFNIFSRTNKLTEPKN